MYVPKKKLLGNGGARLTRQLFIEYHNNGEFDVAVYSLKRHDVTYNGKVYPSLYRLFMEEKDITEARFVSNHLYDWQQWDALVKGHFTKDEIARWRVDLKNIVMGELVDLLLEDAKSDSKSSKSSAKYLVNKLSTGARGKPATAVVPTSEELTSETFKEVAADAKRLRLVDGKD